MNHLTLDMSESWNNLWAMLLGSVNREHVKDRDNVTVLCYNNSSLKTVSELTGQYHRESTDNLELFYNSNKNATGCSAVDKPDWLRTPVKFSTPETVQQSLQSNRAWGAQKRGNIISEPYRQAATTPSNSWGGEKKKSFIQKHWVGACVTSSFTDWDIYIYWTRSA